MSYFGSTEDLAEEPNALSTEGPSTWNHIRELDEVENWAERTRVVSKEDHLLYTRCAQDIVSEVVDKITASEMEQQPSDEFGYMEQFSDSDFQSNVQQLDVDYLEKLGSAHSSQSSSLARESLYVKFDPLVGTASPRRPVQKISKAPSKQLKAVSEDLLMMDTPPRIGIHAVNLPPPHPSPPSATIDILSWSPNQSNPKEPTGTIVDLSSGRDENTNTLIKILKYGDEDIEQLVQSALKEERAMHEAAMATLREECSRKDGGTQKRVEKAERECQAYRAELALHASDKAKLKEELDKWRMQVDKYAESESRIIDCYEKLKEDAKRVEEQRKQAITDFESLEKSFADLHQRYLKLKSTSQGLLKNEQILKQQVSELEEERKADQERYLALEAETKAKLVEANQTFETMKKEATSEVAVAKANIKKMTVQIASLQQALQQKELEKQELTQICDDLMKELGAK